MSTQPRKSPLLAGLALLGAGLLVRQWQPRLLDMPEQADTARDNGTRVQNAARKSRDGVARVLPGNMTGSIGRSLIVMGVGLIAVRTLDLLVDDDDALF